MLYILYCIAWFNNVVKEEIAKIVRKEYYTTYADIDRLLPVVKEVVMDIVEKRELPRIEEEFEKVKFTKQYVDNIIKNIVKQKLSAF